MVIISKRYTDTSVRLINSRAAMDRYDWETNHDLNLIIAGAVLRNEFLQGHYQPAFQISIFRPGMFK